jgi:hypothetical protein
LLLGLMCSESINFRGFWPDFWVVLSLGLLVTALMRGMDIPVPNRR